MRLPFLLLAVAAVVASPSPLRAGGLERVDAVDGLQLDGETRRLQLMVILETDRIDTRAAVRALYTKMYRYQRYIASGRALAEAPAANAALRPAVIVVAPQDASTAEMQNLAGVRLDFIKRGAAVEVQAYIPGLRAVVGKVIE